MTAADASRSRNTHPDRPTDKDDATRTSLLGAHLLSRRDGCAFVSLLDPPPTAARRAAAGCRQHRCWPVLAGADGRRPTCCSARRSSSTTTPRSPPQSAGALFDSTEIDEILTLRVMTMTDAGEGRGPGHRPAGRRDHRPLRRDVARATCSSCTASCATRTPRPPVDRTPTDRRALVGPGGRRRVDPTSTPSSSTGCASPRAAWSGCTRPAAPTRRTCSSPTRSPGSPPCSSDVDGGTHVAVVLVDDPAADLHDWYGRYLYFAPDELEPLPEPTHERRADHEKRSEGSRRVVAGRGGRRRRAAVVGVKLARPTSSGTCEMRADVSATA